MGFFSAKAVCGICGKEVGLNRFKIKKSDAWLCPECFKKAGGVSKVNLGKVTIEEIKEIIGLYDENVSQRADKLVNTPMQTAEGMYRYCVENHYGSGWNEAWGVKHFRLIEDNLMSGEEVLMTFIGLHNYESTTKHDDYFAYAITNRRIIMAQKNVVVGKIVQTVSLDNINDITFRSGIALGVMTIDTFKEVFNVGLNKQSAQRINAKVLETIESAKSDKGQNTQVVTASVSTADEIKKFKELLDAGIITREEFENKKKQLLGV